MFHASLPEGVQGKSRTIMYLLWELTGKFMFFWYQVKDLLRLGIEPRPPDPRIGLRTAYLGLLPYPLGHLSTWNLFRSQEL